ncbi:MAG: toxin TcdB middle/N-terminal domain-containing protein [Pseudomonadota bacterium]
MPAFIRPGGGAVPSSSVGDFNGDGLDDYVQRIIETNTVNPKVRIYLNNGYGFNLQTWELDRTAANRFATDNRWIVGDFNGDGRSDLNIVSEEWYVSGSKSDPMILISTGNGFKLFDTGLKQAAMTADLNGDGLSDIVGETVTATNPLGDVTFRLSNHKPQNLLNRVTTPFGAWTDVTFAPSTDWNNDHLPFVTQTVERIARYDGRGGVSTVLFEYSGGLYDYGERRFLGFRTLTAKLPQIGTEAARPELSVIFSQDFASVGVPTNVRRFDANGTMVARTVTALEGRNDSAPYTSLVKRRTSTLFGNGEEKGLFAEFQHSNFGQVRRRLERGVPSTTGFTRIVRYNFHRDTQNYIVNPVKTIRHYRDTDSNDPERTINLYYDGQTNYSSPPTKGNLTERRVRVEEENQWLTEKFTYDGNGRLIESRTPQGYWTQYEYDPVLTNLVKTTKYPRLVNNGDARWSETTIRLAECGTPQVFTDVNDKNTTYQYDPLCRVTREDRPDGSYADYTYNAFGSPNGQHVRIDYPNTPVASRWDKYFFDGLGRVYKTESPLNGLGTGAQVRTVETTFDNRGNVRKTSAPSFGTPIHFTTYSYDGLDREVKRTFADGRSVDTVYALNSIDTHALQVIVTDAMGDERRTAYDAYGNAIRIVADPLGIALSADVTYDVFGNAKTVTDALGTSIVYTFDTAGRQTQVDDPNVGLRQFVYDKDSRLTQLTDAKGQVTVYGYDSHGRLISQSSQVPNTPNVTLTYDEARPGYDNVGRLTTAHSSEGTYTFDIDVVGRTAKQTFLIDGNTYTRTEEYYPTGFTKKITYPDGDVMEGNVDWTHNADGSLVGVPKLVVSSTFNARGQLTSRNYRNGVRLNRTYNAARGWLEEIRVSKNGGVDTIWQRNFTRDAKGRIQTSSGNIGGARQGDNWRFTYDAAGRLTLSENTETGVNTIYEHDRANNLTRKSGRGFYEYPAPTAPRPHAATKIGGTTLEYDNNGNLVRTRSVTDGAIKREMTWDGWDRLVSVVKGAVLTEMVYGPDGKRQKRKVIPLGGGATETTTFFGDMELSPSGEWTKYPIPDAKRVGPKSYPLHMDYDGSVRVVTEHLTGDEITHLFYQPFGEEERVEVKLSAADETKSFLSERYDESTGLNYLNARYYDAPSGRFI